MNNLVLSFRLKFTLTPKYLERSFSKEILESVFLKCCVMREIVSKLSEDNHTV